MAVGIEQTIRPSAKIIAVVIPKGGVGKTTTAVNLAATLAVFEKRTLLVDTDPAGACSLALGFTAEKVHGGLYEVFNFVQSFGQALHRTELAHLDFVPANVRTPQMDERLQRLAENRTMLKNTLRNLIPHYDYIILDTPPTMRGLTVNALTCADAILIPMKSGHFSLDAIDKLFKFVEYVREIANKSLKIEGILQTMYEANTKVTDITNRELQARYRKHVLPMVIPKNTHLAEAAFYGKPSVMFNATSKGTLAYIELTRYLITRDQAIGAPAEEAVVPA